MFSNRTTNYRINQLYESRLLLVYNDYDSSFDSSFVLCNRDRCLRPTKTYLILFFRDLLITQEYAYKFCRNIEFQIPRVNTVWKGSISTRCFGQIIWDLFPSELKHASSLENFNSRFHKC